VAWLEEDTAAALHAAYRTEQDVAVQPRLHALWLLRDGSRQVGEVAGVLSVNYRTVQRWVAWYRTGGLAAVRTHRLGGPGMTAWLTPEQQETVAAEVATGRFHNALAIRVWVEATFGVSYSDGGRARQSAGATELRSEGPATGPCEGRPGSAGGLEKGGLTAAVTVAGITAEQAVGWADEMRIGLMGTTRRVWGRRGVKVMQPIQQERDWRYLHLVCDPLQGRLWWGWYSTMDGEATTQLVTATRDETDLAALVWDRARGALWALGRRVCGQSACRCSSSRHMHRSSIPPSACSSTCVPGSRAACIHPSPRSCMPSRPCWRNWMLIPPASNGSLAGSGFRRRWPMLPPIMRRAHTGLVLVTG
jgi:transposase